jgi:predicted molibdopterin-dependent oxidoreductase YjgC
VRQADVVLPAAGFAEVRGTTTNLEGRVSTVSQSVTPPGTAQSDWVIASDIARRLGYDLGIEAPEQVWDELHRIAPLYAGIDPLTVAADGVLVGFPARVESQVASIVPAVEEPHENGVNGSGPAVPAAADEATETLGAEAAPATDEGHLPEASAPDFQAPPLPDWTVVEPPAVDSYGLRLVATRKLYDQGTQLRHSGSLMGLAEGAVVRLNPHDFQRLGMSPGDDARVTSARTHVQVPAQPDERVPRGVALLHVNQSGGRVNVNALIDAKTVVTDVRVERP